MRVTRACSICGTTVETEADDEVPLGWSPSFTERGVLWHCPECVRDHVRSIEAKLPEDFWE